MSTTSLSKTLVVKNGLLLLAFHLPRLFGIIYLVIIGLWIKKGYQETDIGTGTVFTKVIGFADTTHRTDLENASRKVWDALDVVGEAQDDQSLFIMTNEISTIGQKRSVCPEDISVAEAHCTLKNRSMCVKGDSILLKGHGIMTGNCVPFPNSTNHTCEIQGWCPAEHSVFKTPALLPEALNFKILLKAFVRFPKFDKGVSNTKADVTDEELISNCKENATNYWDCPIFNVSYILNEAGINDTRRDKIILQGGIIAVTIKWICDFDSDRDGKRCLPDYTFKQLKKETHNNHSVWYFRSVRYDSDKGVQTRDLFRKTGLFFIFNIDAKAGRYDTFTTLLSFGAITGYFRLSNPEPDSNPVSNPDPVPDPYF
uniref:Purinergic receptor n=1 Tax=Plectus sambesii TaxID=2011161 RepID=A0A914UTI8_9BILA